MTERKNRSYDRNGHIWRDGLNCYNLLSATVLATRMGVGLPGCCPGRLGSRVVMFAPVARTLREEVINCLDHVPAATWKGQAIAAPVTSRAESRRSCPRR